MRWRTTITMLVLIALVAGAGWYGYDQLMSPPEPSADDAICDKGGNRLKASDVTVNVYNAGDISGLASKTLATLQRKGFTPGASENAPSRLDVEKAVIYGSKLTSPEVRLVRLQLRDQVRVVRRPNLAEGVDIVVGSNFGGFDGKAPKVLKIKAKKKQQACRKQSDNEAIGDWPTDR